MSDLATGRTPSFSAAESIDLYASSRRTWAKAAQREWNGLTSRLRKRRADVADSAGAAAPDPPAAASGTLLSSFTPLGSSADWSQPLPFCRHID